MSENTASAPTRGSVTGNDVNMPIPSNDAYHENHIMERLNEAVTDDSLEDVRGIILQWQDASEASLPRNTSRFHSDALQPILSQAIKMERADMVTYLLDAGIRLTRQAVVEAISCQSSISIWQVFLEHGLDINEPLSDWGLPPLGFILQRPENVVRWFLSHGADPNFESHFGLTPFLCACGEASLSTVQLIHQAGGDPAISVPFVCSAPTPGSKAPNYHVSNPGNRLAVLRYLLDSGADPNAKKWAHSSRGYGSDFDWGSALNLALVNGYHDCAEELIKRGAMTDAKTLNFSSRNETALELARQYAPALVPLVKESRRREMTETSLEGGA